MKKAKKILALVLSALLLMSLTVVGTLAYLTANTEIVENTFTVGNVTLDNELGNGLDELDVNEYGEEFETTPDPERVLENEYKLVPGHKYIKDPTVHVAEKSEPCYVFVKVVNEIAPIEAAGATTIAAQMANLGWTQLVVEGVNVENVYFYNGDLATDAVVDARAALVDLVVFETFTLDVKADVVYDEDVEGDIDWTKKTITIDAYAIQADGFATPADAWKTAPASWN